MESIARTADRHVRRRQFLCVTHHDRHATTRKQATTRTRPPARDDLHATTHPSPNTRETGAAADGSAAQPSDSNARHTCSNTPYTSAPNSTKRTSATSPAPPPATSSATVVRAIRAASSSGHP